MAKTEALRQRNLCKKKMMVTCILMGLSFKRYADLYEVKSKDVCRLFWETLNSMGWRGTLIEVRQHKLRIIYDLGSKKIQNKIKED